MPLTVRYVRANAAQNLDGFTLANAMNINDALRSPSGNTEYRILKDGVHVVTGSIVPTPTGLSCFFPAYYVGYSDISGLVRADWQTTGTNERQRIDHMPQIMFTGAVNFNNGTAQYTHFANLVMSGRVNGTLFNHTAQNVSMSNLYAFNLSTGSSAVAIAYGFRSCLAYSTCITSGILNNGIAASPANSVNNYIYKCWVSAPSGVGIYLNNDISVVDCVIENCLRGIRNGSSSQGNGLYAGNKFINCQQYCLSQRNQSINTGVFMSYGNVAFNSGPELALVDTNGLADYTYTTGLNFSFCNNVRFNTAAATGIGDHIQLSCVTGNASATHLFVDISGKDFRYASRATGFYNRDGAFGDGVGNAIRTPRLS